MKRIQVYPIMQTIQDSDTDFNIIYDLPTGESVDVVKPSYIAAYFSNFADWYLLKPDNDTRTDEEYLRYIWTEYCNMQTPNWNMLFKALFTTYNPIDNYDITEDNETTYETGDKTLEHKPDGVKDIATVKVESGSGTKVPKTEHFVSTYNNAEKAFERTETAGETTTTTETEIKSSYTDTTTKENDTTTTTLHRHGNAGVMTTAEVIRQETMLRKSELAAEIVLGGFVDKYLFYSGGVTL